MKCQLFKTPIIISKVLLSSKKYVVGGWGSINPEVKGPPIYELMEKYILNKKLIKPKLNNNVKVLGM